MGKHEYTQIYMSMHSNMNIHVIQGIHEYTQVYTISITCIHDYTLVYTDMCEYTQVYMVSMSIRHFD